MMRLMIRSVILSSRFVVVCYDIANDRRRQRVACELENFGQRVQYSVFECHLSCADMDNLKQALNRLIDETEDRVRYYELCPKDKPKIIIDGQGQVTKPADYHII